MKKEKILSLAIICITIIASAFLLTQVDFYIKGWSTATPIKDFANNTISVNWDWKVFATPDILILSLSVEERKDSTAEAQTEVNKKVNQIKEIIEKYKIKDSNVQTKNINVYPEYDYKESGRVLLWYKAIHNIEIKIKNADLENEWIWWKIIDDIWKVWNVMVNNIQYDIEDKTPYYTQARKLAMEKAQQKAEELAKLAWVDLVKPVSISENINTYYPWPMYKNTYSMDMWMAEVSSDTNVSLWELEIDLNIDVLYQID